MEKIKCDCGSIAHWSYGPGYAKGGNPYSCGDCVPRGCECNWIYVKEEEYSPPSDFENLNKWKWLTHEEGKIWVWLDKEGRESPCCEYDYSEEGWNDENTKDNFFSVCLSK